MMSWYISGAVVISSGVSVPGTGLKNNQKTVSHPRHLCLQEAETGQHLTGRKSWGSVFDPNCPSAWFLEAFLVPAGPRVLNFSPSVAYLLHTPYVPGSPSNSHQSRLSVREGRQLWNHAGLISNPYSTLHSLYVKFF